MDRPTTCQQFPKIFVSYLNSSQIVLFHRTIVVVNIISVIMLYYPSYPEVLRTAFTIPNIVLTNVMAGRVFRNTMLFGVWRDGEIELSTIQFQDI